MRPQYPPAQCEYASCFPLFSCPHVSSVIVAVLVLAGPIPQLFYEPFARHTQKMYTTYCCELGRMLLPRQKSSAAQTLHAPLRYPVWRGRVPPTYSTLPTQALWFLTASNMLLQVTHVRCMHLRQWTPLQPAFAETGWGSPIPP